MKIVRKELNYEIIIEGEMVLRRGILIFVQEYRSLLCEVGPAVSRLTSDCLSLSNLAEFHLMSSKLSLRIPAANLEGLRVSVVTEDKYWVSEMVSFVSGVASTLRTF